MSEEAHTLILYRTLEADKKQPANASKWTISGEASAPEKWLRSPSREVLLGRSEAFYAFSNYE